MGLSSVLSRCRGFGNGSATECGVRVEGRAGELSRAGGGESTPPS